MQKCPLCGSQNPKDFPGDGRRAYFRCQACALIFVDRTSLLPAEDEKARYKLHQNNPQDTGYRAFLARLVDPLAERLGVSPLEGLDFGCGPGPTLSVMMEEMGYCMAKYDPFFFLDPAVLDKQYDFVTCTEAIEHFYFPNREWKRLVGLVKPGGWLGIMTKLVTEGTSFTDWYYAGDPTHVCFFSRETFRFLGESDGLQVSFVGDNVVLLQRGI
jgi:Methyltransferase domain